MGRVVPGYGRTADLAKTGAEFHVEGRVRHEPRCPAVDGRARFHPVSRPVDALDPGELRFMTIRSEDQFNTLVGKRADAKCGTPSYTSYKNARVKLRKADPYPPRMQE